MFNFRGVVPNYFDRFNLDPKKYKIIPITGGPTKFYSIAFEGWKRIIISEDDENFHNLMDLIGSTINNFVILYSETYAFTQPEIIYRPDGIFLIKIGTMSIEMYGDLKCKGDEDV